MCVVATVRMHSKATKASFALLSNKTLMKMRGVKLQPKLVSATLRNTQNWFDCLNQTGVKPFDFFK